VQHRMSPLDPSAAASIVVPCAAAWREAIWSSNWQMIPTCPPRAVSSASLWARTFAAKEKSKLNCAMLALTI
jgi:hypothetical protein